MKKKVFISNTNKGYASISPYNLYGEITSVEFIQNTKNRLQFQLKPDLFQESPIIDEFDFLKENISIGQIITVHSLLENIDVKITNKEINELEEIVVFSGVVEKGERKNIKDNLFVTIFPKIVNLEKNSPPKDLFASKNINGKSKVKWKDSTADKAISYNLRWREANDEYWNFERNIKATEFEITGLENKKIYEISVMSNFRNGDFSYYSDNFILYF